MWRTRQWRLLLSLVDRLPGHSRLAEAIAGDEESAAAMLAAHPELLDPEEPGQEPPAPRLSDWSPEVAALTVIADRLTALIDVQVRIGGGTGRQPKPEPRPQVALQRLRAAAIEESRQSQHRSLVARLLPASPEEPARAPDPE